MKKFTINLLLSSTFLFLSLLPSFAQFDDVYYNPKTDYVEKAESYTAVNDKVDQNNQNNQNNEGGYEGSSSISNGGTYDNQAYNYDNNNEYQDAYYDGYNDAYSDFYYTRRINQFSFGSNYGFGDPFFYGNYSYDPFDYNYGFNNYGFRFWNRRSIWWDCSPYYNSGIVINNYYGNSWGWCGNPGYNYGGYGGYGYGNYGYPNVINNYYSRSYWQNDRYNTKKVYGSRRGGAVMGGSDQIFIRNEKAKERSINNPRNGGNKGESNRPSVRPNGKTIPVERASTTQPNNVLTPESRGKNIKDSKRDKTIEKTKDINPSGSETGRPTESSLKTNERRNSEIERINEPSKPNNKPYNHDISTDEQKPERKSERIRIFEEREPNKINESSSQERPREEQKRERRNERVRIFENDNNRTNYNSRIENNSTRNNSNNERSSSPQRSSSERNSPASSGRGGRN